LPRSAFYAHQDSCHFIPLHYRANPRPSPLRMACFSGKTAKARSVKQPDHFLPWCHGADFPAGFLVRCFYSYPAAPGFPSERPHRTPPLFPEFPPDSAALVAFYLVSKERLQSFEKNVFIVTISDVVFDGVVFGTALSSAPQYWCKFYAPSF